VKKVSFNSVKIKNFLSVGEGSLEISFQKGINLITGENRDKGGRNGVGKSTVIESLYWCLFGNTMRDIKKDKVIHHQAKKGCEVILSFNIFDGQNNTPYTITRSLEPSKVSVISHLDQKDIDMTHSTMPETNEYIKELIGASEEIFQNAVIMTANNTLPFMAQKKVDKRKFVEGILNLGIFGQMLLQVRSDYNEIKKENDILGSKFIDQQKNLKLYKDQASKNEESKNNKILALKTKIEINDQKIKNVSNQDSVRGKINDLDKEIDSKESDLEALEEGLKKVKRLISDTNAELLQANYEIGNLEKQKQKLKTESACPTCKRKYDENANLDDCLKEIEDKLIPLQDKKNPLRKTLEDLNKKESKVESAITSTKQKIKALNKDKGDLALAIQELSQLEKRNIEILEEISTLRNEKDGILELIDNVEVEIFESEKQIQAIQKKLTILDTSKYVVSEEGVKTYIIKKMLNLLNSRLNHYLQILEAPCKCEFNELFEESIHNDQGKECSYFNFSGGERKRIDLAILFMFQDVLRTQTGTSFSLSMYDELLDSAVDEKGAEKILEILKNRVEDYDECVYIVSHNKSVIKNGLDNIIQLEKINGKTRLMLD
jgi:DNA repair exonuclease SbcCD ATPase subunit